MQLDLLAIGVHPDDIELCATGTLLKHIDLGYTCGILDLTQGELGTRGSAELRLQEARASADIQGIAVRENVGMADGFFQHSKENVLKIATVLRRYRPKIVLCNAVRDRHPDHGRAAKLTPDACFYSGLRKVTTNDEAGKAQEAWRPKAVYHYIQDYNLTPDFAVDITDYMERKLDAVMAFKSQFYDPDSTEPATPISGLDFKEFLRAKARTYGRPIGADYAEGFTVARTIGVSDLFDLT